MKKLFFYVQKLRKNAQDTTNTPLYAYRLGSFNIDNVVRTLWTPRGYMVMLNDGHEEAQDVQKPVKNKQGMVVTFEEKRERGWYVSEIILSDEEMMKLQEVCALNQVTLPEDDVFPESNSVAEIKEATIEEDSPAPAGQQIVL